MEEGFLALFVLRPEMMQMQQLMAAQYRMVALEESRRAAIEEQARIRHKRFRGDGVAYRRN